ncbi:MAG: type II secretion system F family protein [Candidatus Sumerlaeota bacterium]|nr:type II secretion system F family protein [Candidatus Sumerlaeota bacterium]
MATFQYTARNAQGALVTGSLEAADQAAASRSLREKGMIPSQIMVAAAAKPKRRMKSRRGRIKLDDMVVFSRQLAVMIRAGLPLIEILNILAEQLEKRRFQEIVGQIEREVEAGSTFTEALQRHPRVFNQFFISMIRAGEAAGMLDTILEQVATYLEKSASLQRKIKAAVAYPAFVSGFALCLIWGLMVFVIPKFEDIFSGLGSKMPLMTQIVINISRFMINYWYIMIALIVGGVIGIRLWYRTNTGRHAIDAFKLKVPVFGPLFLKGGVAKFTRTLSTLIRAGVNILSALEIVARTSGNILIEDALYKTRASIQGGESISKPMDESGVFPPMVVRMIAVGERTGNLESMLQKIADFYEDQVDATVSALTSLIEPLLIIILGVIVGCIVISMFLPMFKMLEDLG